MQQEINESVLEKIQKLFNMANSAKEIGSLAEAEAFMTKVQVLLQEHNLEMSTVQDHQRKEKSKIEEQKIKFGAVKSDGDWEKNLMCVICRNNWCTNFWNDFYKTHTVVGQAENIAVVTYLYNFIQPILKELSGKGYSDAIIKLNNFYKAHGRDYITQLGGKIKAEQYFCKQGVLAWRKVWVRNFLLGAVQGIDVKLTQQRIDAAAASNQMMGLMVINQNQLEKYIADTQPDLKIKNLKTGDDNKGGFVEGYKVGRNLEIYKAIDTTVEEEKNFDRYRKFEVGDIVEFTSRDGKKYEVNFRGYHNGGAIIVGKAADGINQMQVDLNQLKKIS